MEKIHRTRALLMEWDRARIVNSSKPCSNTRSLFVHNLQEPQFHISQSLIQYDQEQCAFHTELI